MNRITKGLIAGTLACVLATVGSSALAQNILGDDFKLEIETEPTPTPQPQELIVNLDGTVPQPGATPKISSLSVEMLPTLTFASPMTPAKAELANQEGSGVIVVYVLRISVAEVLRTTGRTGYTLEAFEALSAEEGFDPEESYITLSQSKGVPPGMTVHEITLGTLPDGSTLPAGDYTGLLLMVPFGEETLTQAMVNVNFEMQFTVQSDVILLELDLDGCAPVQAFNPIDETVPVRFGLLISQAQVREKTGAPHNSEEALARQATDPAFSTLHEEYEFMPIFQSDWVAPGEFLEKIEVGPLPDGAPLPSGTYIAWLARYRLDEAGNEIMADARTQVQLIIP